MIGTLPELRPVFVCGERLQPPHNIWEGQASVPVRISRIVWILNHNDHVDMVRHNNVMVDRYVWALIGKKPDGTLDLSPNGESSKAVLSARLSQSVMTQSVPGTE